MIHFFYSFLTLPRTYIHETTDFRPPPPPRRRPVRAVLFPTWFRRWFFLFFFVLTTYCSHKIANPLTSIQHRFVLAQKLCRRFLKFRAHIVQYLQSPRKVHQLVAPKSLLDTVGPGIGHYVFLTCSRRQPKSNYIVSVPFLY